jgi:hypothetical protein
VSVWIEKPLLVEAKGTALRLGTTVVWLTVQYTNGLLEQIKTGRRLGAVPEVERYYLRRDRSKMIKMPAELLERVKEESVRRGVTVRAFVTFALREGLYGRIPITPPPAKVSKARTGPIKARGKPGRKPSGNAPSVVTRIPGDLKQELERVAMGVNTTVSGLVSEVLREVVDDPDAYRAMLERVGPRLPQRRASDEKTKQN